MDSRLMLALRATRATLFACAVVGQFEYSQTRFSIAVRGMMLP